MDSLQIMGNGYNTPWIPFSNLVVYDSFQDFTATRQGFYQGIYTISHQRTELQFYLTFP